MENDLLALSKEYALAHKFKVAGTECLLLAIIETDVEIKKLLLKYGISYKSIVTTYTKYVYQTSFKIEEAILTPTMNDIFRNDSIDNKGALISIITRDSTASGIINMINPKAIECLLEELEHEETSKTPAEGTKEQDNTDFLIGKNIDDLKQGLQRVIAGQDHVIETLCNSLVNQAVGFGNPYKPKGSFLFCGPTGVGKTELAKQLAKLLHISVVTINMPEYSEKVSITKLIGSAPGYVGYEDGGQLTEKIKNQNKAVIIFDEIEKAHPDIFNIFLQLLDEGKLTDSKGIIVSFTSCIIIFTSNLGYSTIENYQDANKEDFIDAVYKTFKPEFISRLDNIVAFNKLTDESIKKIIDVNLENMIKNEHFNICLAKDLSTKLFESFSQEIEQNKGARGIQNLIRDKVITPLSYKVNNKDFVPGDKIIINIFDNQVSFKKVS